MSWTYILIAICCVQFPLLNVLGYEASMLFGVVGAVVTLLTVELPYKRENFAIWWVLESKRQILPLLSPIVVFGITSIFVQNCLQKSRKMSNVQIGL